MEEVKQIEEPEFSGILINILTQFTLQLKMKILYLRKAL